LAALDDSCVRRTEEKWGHPSLDAPGEQITCSRPPPSSRTQSMSYRSAFAGSTENSTCRPLLRVAAGRRHIGMIRYKAASDYRNYCITGFISM